MRETKARLVLLLLVAVVVAAAVAAAPAAAATSTTLTLSAQSRSVKWGATAILNGILQTSTQPPLPVDRQQLQVQYSVASNGPVWTTAATVTNTAAPYSSGEYHYSWTASRNYYWQMTFAGTAEWAGTTSNVVYVKVVPVIGKPACPLSARAGRKFTVSGSLKPRYPAGSRNVTVKALRYASGRWRAYKTYLATTADSGSYSKYSVRLSISRKGKYRFYATTANTSSLSAGKSANSRSLQVK